ncbi:hypothetical protein F4553_006731 [Allocatelliglobosispora scoriae]|uniref:Uncharacterized protein n=1 Tax=Allocatelliglobosispora scoriae TaxID=643052 RepID=A0A841BW17_9ACTN|nr:hypothetical protein [Allocatelliglobosispora scoriae]MBB5873297.1 hypothetical protein [Allocatelliglobosispora scoriae]
MAQTATTPAPANPREQASSDSTIAKIFKKLCAYAPLLAGLALMGYAIRVELPIGSALTAALSVLLVQVLPGALVWRSVRPRPGWLVEDLVIGFAIGSVLAIIAQVGAGLAHVQLLSFSPLLVAVALLAAPGSRARILAAQTRALPWWWGPPIAFLFLFMAPQLRSYFRMVPLSWPSGARAPDIDAYLHLALAGQLAHRGPTTFPWVESESLAYHWFSHAWVAQVSQTSTAGLDEVLFRFMPALMPVVVVLSVAIAAVRLTGHAWAGPAAGAIALIGGDLNVVGAISAGFPLTPLSPSLGLGAPMLVGAVLVMALRWKKAMLSGSVFVLPLLALGASGSKGSTLPLVVAGLGLALVAMFVFNRGQIRAVLGDLAMVIGVLIFSVVVVFHGSGAGLHISPTDAAEQTAAARWLGNPQNAYQYFLIFLLAAGGALARGSGALALLFSRSGRRSPTTWLLIGAGVASVGAIVVFAHPGWSQWYFVRTAEPVLALGSVLGLAALADVITERSQRIRLAVTGLVGGLVLVALGPVILGPVQGGAWLRVTGLLGIAALVLVAIAALTWFTATDRAQRLRLTGAALILTVLAGGVYVTVYALRAKPAAPRKPIPMTQTLATSRGEIDAARWIRDHSDVDDVVMSNRHCTTPIEPFNCDSRRFVVAAFSERQVLLEGWTATPMSAKLGPNGRDSISVSYWHQDLQALNDGFIAQPTADGARQLRERGVRWVYVDHTRPYAQSLEPFATLRFQSDGVDVYEFTPGS